MGIAFLLYQICFWLIVYRNLNKIVLVFWQQTHQIIKVLIFIDDLGLNPWSRPDPQCSHLKKICTLDKGVVKDDGS